MDLQNQLKKVEEDIANSRKYYNALVREYNDVIMSVPTNIVASLFHLKRRQCLKWPMLRKEKMFKLNFKKVLAFLFAFILCFSVVDIHADDGGYTIDDYKVNAIYHSIIRLM